MIDPAIAGKPPFKVCLACLKIGLQTDDEIMRLSKLGPPLPPCIDGKRQQDAENYRGTLCNKDKPPIARYYVHI